MCKYNTYAIEIVHLNGNKQLREAEDSSSYNNTIALYHNIKEEYINREVTINFIGFTKDGEQVFFFGKKNTLIENEKRNIKNLLSTISEASRELHNQYKIINGKVSYYDKEKSNIEHLLIEAADVDQLTNEDKVNIFDQIREVSLIRRDYKILNEIRTQTIPDLDSIISRIDSMTEKYEKHIKNNSKKLKDLIKRSDDYSGVHLIKEFNYKDDKQKITIMKLVQNKYDRVIQFPERKVIACYNKCG